MYVSMYECSIYVHACKQFMYSCCSMHAVGHMCVSCLSVFCMCVCMHLCMNVCSYVGMYGCMHAFMHVICKYVSLYQEYNELSMNNTLARYS